MTSSSSSSSSSISQALDILPFLLPSNPKKYTRYLPPRNLFFSSFPPNGQFIRLPTPSNNLLCGLYAIILSFQHRYPSLIPIPTLKQLHSIILQQAKEHEKLIGLTYEKSNLTGDQLSACFSEWVRIYIPGKRGQLGWVSEVEQGKGEIPVMMDTKEVKVEEEGNEKEDIIRVWVWNDGGWVNGGMGHWEGIKRVD
ncbi:hypothetical protein QBC38DRAFT_236460 [Podospora fimiseda]|uniref:Uncharacterized protein n=1 Tax=Podospora fimiseda TaxID=252190 RepID=A0AAN7GSX0_9PEZI|nr:hypothetical protein QBC38DRAFT_236460 [Podospora fimiseda]